MDKYNLINKDKGEGNKREKGLRNLSRRAEIYQKALDLFVKKGYDGTSMSMIAKVLGMSKANLYYYCSSKEDLLYRIHLDDLQRRFIPILDEVERIEDPKDRLIQFLERFTLMCASSPSSKVLIHEVRSLNREHQNEILSIWRRAYELTRGAISELQRSGRARRGRESFLTFLATGMVFWIPYWFDYSRQGNTEELAKTLSDIFLNGLLYPMK